MATRNTPGLELSIIEFCRFARESGLPAGVKEGLDALRAASAVGVAGRENLKFALRAVLCSSKAGWDLFEEVFEAFWSRSESGAWQKPSGQRNKNSAEDTRQENAGQSLIGQSSSLQTEGEGKATLGATAH